MTLQQKLLAKQSKKGFTLVELVVVIAILGILAAIAIPSVIAIINSANSSAGKTDAATVDAACKDYYALIQSGTVEGKDLSTQALKKAELNKATIKEALEYANIYNDVALSDMSVDKSGTIFDTESDSTRADSGKTTVLHNMGTDGKTQGSGLLKSLYTGTAQAADDDGD